MKKLIKRVCSTLVSLQLIACSTAVSAFAGSAQGAPDIINGLKPEHSTIKPTLSLSQVQASAGSVASVELSVSGAEGKYAPTSLHIKYDNRLELVTRDGELAEIGPAGRKLSYDQEVVGDDMILLETFADKNVGRDGVLWTMDFKVPADSKIGDVFPVSIYYEQDDRFTNVKNDEEGQLMEAWVFSNGIEQGAITAADVSDEKPITTTTTAKVTTTTTTTTKTTTTALETTVPQKEIKPQLSISKVQAAPIGGSIVRVDLSVSGADGAYANTTLAVKYDERLKLVGGQAEFGPAGEKLISGQAQMDEPENEICLVTAGRANYGRDGVLWSFDFVLPADVVSGDKFYIDFDFFDSYCFDDYDEENSEFMRNWAKDHAENGYIEITDDIDIEEPVYFIGDVNGDGMINIVDATLVLVMLRAPDRFTDFQRGAADMNFDGKVTFADYVLLLVYIYF